MHTIKDLLLLVTTFLSKRGSKTPRLDAEIIVAEGLGVKRLDLYLMFEKPIKEDELSIIREMVRRRARGEPIAYITGKKEFYGLLFEVNPSVLIPRPETETIVEGVVSLLKPISYKNPLIVDIGCGSGAIACAVAANIEFVRVIATDISLPAVEVAKRNIERLGLSAKVFPIVGDCLSPLRSFPCADLIVSNPPYVGLHEATDKETMYEPKIALYSGEDGTTFTKVIIGEALNRLFSGGYLVIEVGSVSQRKIIEDYIRGYDGYTDIKHLKDPAKYIRGLVARKV